MKYKSKLTSAIGAIIIIGAMVSVFIGKSDWLQAGAIITIGTGFFLTKDHNVS